MKHKKIFTVSIIILVFIIVSGIFTALYVKSQMKDLFQMNKELQEQGYYMGDFEFKMLGLSYWLDKGNYFRAFSGINRLHKQMESKEGLIKIPEFNNKKDEMEFYLNLQNPRTGAFMDDSYPYSTYTGPTGNVLAHLDALAEETNQPLKLKYPLKYLDEINTPQKLNVYLNDVSTVGWIALKFPQTSFHNARDVLSLFYEDNTVEKYNLYEVTSEWKNSLLQWFYDNQDPKTGVWGPKSKSGKLVKKDLMNSASIIKAFVDENGNNLHEEFPLRYQNELAETILEESFFEQLPDDDEIDEWHEWSLNTPKSIRTITRYLWKDLSQEKKNETKKLIENYIKIKFEKFYIPNEGAFSYYPNSEHATLDGTGSTINDFVDAGFFSMEKQKQLWGMPEKNMNNLGTRKISEFSKNDFDSFANSKNINSIRIYSDLTEDSYFENVEMIIYPKETFVLDVMDLTPKVKNWIGTTPQTMGNWVSKEVVLQDLEAINIVEVSVYNEIPIGELNEILQEKGKIIVIGFDILQVPRYKITFEF
jgi:hypothetical protein